MLIFFHVFGPCSPTQCLLRHKISPIACWAIYRFQSISVSNVCRSLRKQHRIRLHINLFLSFVFKELMGILWDMLVTYDKVQSTNVFETTLLQNGVSTDSFLWNYCLRQIRVLISLILGQTFYENDKEIWLKVTYFRLNIFFYYVRFLYTNYQNQLTVNFYK